MKGACDGMYGSSMLAFAGELLSPSASQSVAK